MQTKPSYSELENRIALLQQQIKRMESESDSLSALKESEANLVAIIENTLESIWSVDRNYIIQYINKTFKEAISISFGVNLEIGQNIVQALPKEIGELWKARYDKAFREGHYIFTDEMNIQGFMIYIEVAINPIIVDDEIVGLSCYAKNITDLKQNQAHLIAAKEKAEKSEAYLQTLVSALPDLIWLKDEQGVYLNCNKRFEEFFGASETEIVGKTDYDFVDKDLADFFRSHDKAAIKAGKPSMNEEEITFASDGHKEFLETIKTPLYDRNKNVLGVLGIGRDITERIKYQEKLKIAKA